MKPLVFAGHRGEIEDLFFAGGGADLRLLSASRDRSARVWNLANEQGALTLGGHLGFVHGAVSLSSGAIVTVCHDCGVRLFDGKTGELVRLLKGHTSAVTAIATSDNRRHFATASHDGSVRIWRENGDAGPVLRGHASGAISVSFGADGVVVSTSRANVETRWDARTGDALQVIEDPPRRESVFREESDIVVGAIRLPEIGEGATCMGLLGDGFLYVAYENGELHVIRASDGSSFRLRGHDDVISAVACSPDGELIATGAADGTIHVWRWRAALLPPSALSLSSASPPKSHLWQRHFEEVVVDTRFSGDSVWVGRANVIHEVNSRTGTPIREVRGKGDVAVFGRESVLFSLYTEAASIVDRKSGKAVLTVPLEGSYIRPTWVPKGSPIPWVTQRKKKPDHARIVDVETRRVIATLGPMKGASEQFVLSADASRLLVVGNTACLWLWDVRTEELVTLISWNGEPAFQAAFTHDGARIVIGTRGGRAYVFDGKTGVFLFELAPPPNSDPYLAWVPVCISPASDRVVIGGWDNRHARLYDTVRGRFIATLFKGERSGWISSGIAFSPDGSRIIAALNHLPRLAFLDAATGDSLFAYDVHRDPSSPIHIRFLAGGERFLTWASGRRDRSIRAWDLKSGARLWSNLGIGGKRIGYFVISPNERFAAVTSHEWDRVRLIDLETGETIADLADHPDYAREPSFSEDSRLLATSSNDHVVQVWEIG